jgi:DNA-binding CsgD family transcriptional regulator
MTTYINQVLDEIGEQGEFVGHPVWTNCVDERQVRADFAECLLTGKTMEMVSGVRARNGATATFRYAFHRLPAGREHRVACVWHQPTFGPELTGQEHECVRLLARGLRYNEIANLQFVAESTVKSAITRAKEKLGARTSAQLTALAACHGLV